LTVLAACVEGELHELGLRMVSGLLRQRGVRMHFLGANVAPSFLVESVMMREPDAVVLSVTIEQNRPALMNAIRALRTALPPQVQPIVVVGGPDKSELSDEHLGDVRPLQAKSMSDAVEEIMTLPNIT
jgi:methanogenic corrinoid protein MtbC1